MRITIGIIEHVARTRERLAAALAGHAENEIAFVVGSAEEGLQQMEQRAPRVVLVDVDLPGMQSGELLVRLQESQPHGAPTEAIVLGASDDDERVFEAVSVGAVGFLPREAPDAQVLEVVDTLQAGGALLAPALARRMLELFEPDVTLQEVARSEHLLTGREHEILSLLAEGFSYDNIGARLELSTHTVRTHIRNMYRKLRVNSRAQAVYEGLKRRIIALT
jgi:DNA-binding NarL/FixJ family response regulator